MNEIITEKWTQKYKSSINCSHPKGFSQKAHCAGKKKHNEDMTMEAVCPDCGMCQTHGNINEIKKGAKDSNGFTKCWSGYHAAGTKKGKNGGQVRNCVSNEGVAEGSLNEFDPGEGGFGPFKLYKGSPHHYDHIDTFSSLNAAEEEMEFQKDMAAQEGSIDYYKIIDGTGEEVGGFDPDNAYDDMRRGSKIQNRKPGEQGVAEDWQKVNRHDKTDGLSKKAVSAYRREHPGSKLKTAVTTKPSKLKKGSKSAKRRASFCARMSGMKKHRTGAKTKRDPDSNINKALRRWNCESIEEMQQLIMLGEQYISKLKEDGSAGGTSSGSIASVSMPLGGKKKKKGGGVNLLGGPVFKR